MEVKEYLRLRNDLIDSALAADDDNVFSEDVFLYKTLSDLVDVKLIESDDITFSYVNTLLDDKKIKING